MNHDVLWTQYDMDGTLDKNGNSRHWYAHAVQKQTERFVYVAVADEDGISCRINREQLESTGKAWAHNRSYYTPEAKERKEETDRLARIEMRHDAGSRELATVGKQLALGGKLDFLLVAPGILKARGFPVYAHDGDREAVDAYVRDHEPRRDSFITFAAFNLDEIRSKIACGTIGEDELCIALLCDFAEAELDAITLRPLD